MNVPTEIFETAWRLFGGETPRPQFQKKLSEFVSELGDGTREADVCTFLRHQHKNRDLRGARIAIAVVCNVAEFREWDRRRSSTPRPPLARGAARPEPIELATLSSAAQAAAAAARAPIDGNAPRRP